MERKKLVIISTYADDNSEKATLPFVIGTAALASEIDVVIALQSNAVHLATKGYARHVHADGFPAFQELLTNFLSLGGKLYVCGPCINNRSIKPDELIEGAKVVNAAGLSAELVDSDAQLSY
jgi:predicted peroxiredoxin